MKANAPAEPLEPAENWPTDCNSEESELDTFCRAVWTCEKLNEPPGLLGTLRHLLGNVDRASDGDGAVDRDVAGDVDVAVHHHVAATASATRDFRRIPS